MRSYERQGLDIIPTVHMGTAVSALERKGIATNIGNLNRDIKAANRMMNAIRSTIKSLRDWIADILEATKEVIAENEAEKKNASPNLAVLLRDYLNLRKAERSEWSRYGQQKGTTDDLKTISQATVYLQRHELFTLEDLDIALQGVSEKATAIREDMQKAANRMKAITAIQTAVADCEKHKAVHDKYIKIGWKIRKEAYAKPRNAINTHCKGALKRGALTEGGVQELTFIPEGDVYRLIVHSRLPGAERFEKWVFDEVLPMIRKTGGYMTASLLEQAAEKPEILLAFADQLLAEHEKNRQLSGEVERLRPKADFYDAFVHEENCTNIRATAKELQIGERAFCRFLMDAGFLYRCPAGYLLPYAKPSNNGLFRVKDFWKYGHFGQQTLITPQGKNVIRLLLDDGQMRLEWKERMG